MRPLDRVRLGPEAFGSVACCLGEQLVALLRAIEELRPNLKWFVADAQTLGSFPVPRREPTPMLIGDARALIQAAQEVDQFESGVFAGVPPAIARPAFRAGGLFTEDDEAADLGDAVVEVRAFDTSYWTIATAAPNLAKITREQLLTPGRDR
ncbi:MAG: hypothetical protein JNJ54_06785 [Myxococcaceae bacterium]|nr:hypothetical protein [Myxococcaceae bacterium]